MSEAPAPRAARPVRVCVFCGKAEGKGALYRRAAETLAETLAGRGFSIVYGGANVGTMNALANAGLAAGGEVIGVITHRIAELGRAHSGLSQLRVTQTLHERTRIMADESDAFVALPGGVGTLDEFFEAWHWTQSGLQHKPIALLNISGYWDPLLEMFDRMVGEEFLDSDSRTQIIVADTADELVEQLSKTLHPDSPAQPAR